VAVEELTLLNPSFKEILDDVHCFLGQTPDLTHQLGGETFQGFARLQVKHVDDGHRVEQVDIVEHFTQGLESFFRGQRLFLVHVLESDQQVLQHAQRQGCV
jgi:hypothetical protein